MISLSRMTLMWSPTLPRLIRNTPMGNLSALLDLSTCCFYFDNISMNHVITSVKFPWKIRHSLTTKLLHSILLLFMLGLSSCVPSATTKCHNNFKDTICLRSMIQRHVQIFFHLMHPSIYHLLFHSRLREWCDKPTVFIW